MTANNETEALMLDHRTIRKFKDQPLDSDRVDNLLAIAQRTATSNFMQAYTVIRIKDKQQLARMSELGNHQFTGGEELVMFIADQKRNVELAQKAGQSIEYMINFDRFLGGFYDATLAAQSFALAAESEGLGSLIMGSFLDDVQATIEALELPQYTFPVLGVAIGVPDDKPEKKPRLNKSLFQMTDKYRPAPDYDAQMEDYDQRVYQYYNTRAGAPRQEKFSEMINRFAAHGNPSRDAIFSMVAHQGFKLE
ncbi:nitroreductase family protein [Paucilactobacillus nenjiangensis]|jgi:FMN reductase (NADPH)|uniref:NADPH-dependent oxidoreductase n=1 Tax=Paucilactobacillus nenjiangensis TaxID=1296540 RepID=A0A5P1WZL3_9LACO|nr:nitroreductase family protein [Paucilactobacillus nenjiangensis]QER67080.1 NADPH-dependent oxidoreductase [Paucilactobacillus nenjiangensis]